MESENATGLVSVVTIRRYWGFLWLGAAPIVHPSAAPPQDCPCGSKSWASLTAADGEVKHLAKCNACGFEQDIYFDPYTGPQGATAAPVSPWETPNSAEADLRWYYSESDGDLGAHSSWESKVQLAHFGNDSSPAVETIMGEATAATPTDRKIWAAKRWARIRAGLQKLERRHQAVLERRFMLRRQNIQLVGLVGSDNEPVVYELIVNGETSLKALVNEPKERERMKTRAGEALSLAIGAYVLACEVQRGFRSLRRPLPAREQASARGAGKRRLVPRSAPIGSWSAPVEA
jgi:hypothetical protein